MQIYGPRVKWGVSILTAADGAWGHDGGGLRNWVVLWGRNSMMVRTVLINVEQCLIAEVVVAIWTCTKPIDGHIVLLLWGRNGLNGSSSTQLWALSGVLRTMSKDTKIIDCKSFDFMFFFFQSLNVYMYGLLLGHTPTLPKVYYKGTFFWEQTFADVNAVCPLYNGPYQMPVRYFDNPWLWLDICDQPNQPIQSIYSNHRSKPQNSKCQLTKRHRL